MKQTIIDALLSTKREGIEELVKHMEETGFFEAPCSGAFHLAKKGGLAEHSVNVYKTCIKLNTMLEAGIDYSSIVIASLLHDLGKAGDYGKPNYVPNCLKNGELSTAKPYTTNSELLYIPHEVRSIEIAERYIKLTEEEAHAIYYHNGKYTHTGYDLKETPLQMILHFADLWSSRYLEVNK